MCSKYFFKFFSISQNKCSYIIFMQLNLMTELMVIFMKIINEEWKWETVCLFLSLLPLENLVIVYILFIRSKILIPIISTQPDGTSATNLQEVDLKVVSDEECEVLYHSEGIIHPYLHICAGPALEEQQAKGVCSVRIRELESNEQHA